MKEFGQILILMIVPALLYSCSSSKNNRSIGKYAISDSNLYVWVNLMPGSKPRFHVTGDIEIRGNGDVQLDSVILKEVRVLQNNDTLYNFRPIIDIRASKTENSNPALRNIHFSDGRGYEIGSMFNFDKQVKLQMLFFYKMELYVYNTREIKVEKVY